MQKYISPEELKKAVNDKASKDMYDAMVQTFPRKATLRQAIEKEPIYKAAPTEAVDFMLTMAGSLKEEDVEKYIPSGVDSLYKNEALVSGVASNIDAKERRRNVALLVRKADYNKQALNGREIALVNAINQNILEILQGNMNRVGLDTFIEKARRFFTGRATQEDMQGEQLRFAGSLSKSMNNLIESERMLSDEEADFMKSVFLEAAEDVVWGPNGHMLKDIKVDEQGSPF